MKAHPVVDGLEVGSGALQQVGVRLREREEEREELRRQERLVGDAVGEDKRERLCKAAVRQHAREQEARQDGLLLDVLRDLGADARPDELRAGALGGSRAGWGLAGLGSLVARRGRGLGLVDGFRPVVADVRGACGL